jgi:hypothetical protein
LISSPHPPNKYSLLMSSTNCSIPIFANTTLFSAGSVVLYGCEIWSLTLREEHRLRVSENRVLRRILDRRGMR